MKMSLTNFMFATKVLASSKNRRVTGDVHQRAETEWKFSGTIFSEAHLGEVLLKDSREKRGPALQD